MRLVKPKYHTTLAEYFASKDFYLESIEDQRKRAKQLPPSPRPINTRKVVELPWQRIQAQDWDEVEKLFMDLSFLEAKNECEKIFDLVNDFSLAIKNIPSERPYHRILRLVEEALRRDIHFIHRHNGDYPQALFQCLWNSCWWFDCPEVWAHYSHHYDKIDEHLHNLMQEWREQKETTHQGFLWLRSLRPPRARLGTPLLLVMAGHEGEVQSVSISPAGDRIVSGSWDRTVRLWNARNGKEIACLRGPVKMVDSVAFSPGGERIAVALDDKTIRIWDASSGQELACLRGHENGIRTVLFSPDGKWIASAGGESRDWADVVDYSIRLWDAANGRELARLRGHKHLVESMSFSPSGDRLVSGSWDKTIRIWDAYNGNELACLPGHDSEVRAVSFSPEGSRIASGLENGTISVWDAVSGSEILQIWVGSKSVMSLSFSPDGNLIVSGSKDTMVKVWDAHTGQEVACLSGHNGKVTSVSFSPDGGRIISGSYDWTIRIWDLSEFQKPDRLRGYLDTNRLRGHFDTIVDVCFSPTGDRIATGSKDGTIRIWDAGTGHELACMGPADGKTPFWKLWFSPDGTRIVSRAYDPEVDDGWERVWVWDVNKCQKLTSISPYARSGWNRPLHYFTLLIFSPDGERVASAADDNTVRVWDMRTDFEFPPLRGHQSSVRGVSFSHSADLVVSGSDDKTIRVWEVGTGREIACLHGHKGSIVRVSFSPDGRQIVSGSDDKTIRVWEVGTWREVSCLQGHERGVSVVSFSPVGDRIVSALDDKTVRVWDVATGHQLACLVGHEAWVRSASFSPSGDQIVSASNDGTVRVWDVGSGRELSCLHGAGLWSLSIGKEEMPLKPNDDTVRVWNAESFECLRLPVGEVTSTIRTMALRAIRRKAETKIETLWPVQEVAWFPAILNAATTCYTRRPWVGTAVEYLYLLVLEGSINETEPPLG